MLKNYTSADLLSNYRKSKIKKKKILKEVNGNRILLHLLKNKDKNYVQLLKNHASKKETEIFKKLRGRKKKSPTRILYLVTLSF